MTDDNVHVQRPIVVTRDGWLISGYGEVPRRFERGETTGPAFILQVDYEGADEELLQRLHWLAESIQAGEIADYPLFPGGQLVVTATPRRYSPLPTPSTAFDNTRVEIITAYPGVNEDSLTLLQWVTMIDRAGAMMLWKSIHSGAAGEEAKKAFFDDEELILTDRADYLASIAGRYPRQDQRGR